MSQPEIFTLDEILEAARRVAGPGMGASIVDVLSYIRDQRDEDRRTHVQVGFPRTPFSSAKPKLYTYRCRDCSVGDWVVVPPTGVGDGSGRPQLLQVKALGLGGTATHGRIRPAQRVDCAIANGDDF